ncbi:AraC family transcriptional regulator [Flavobacterium sp.]|uniref:AraC family transcriptional regulator n=1 Tax=Flavobacterium sp. TaxID=239 RepID=UPI0012111792|nr:AraC family transcriptional regulator [Flavobacterium sp.]RZJ72539.1 MAG: helix-turn-helix domain-containing protein [Flavobacterium sp.]
MKKIEILGLDKFRGKNPLPDFYVNNLKDHLATNHLHIEKPHKHDFFATMIFTVGSGKHHIDFNTYDVKPGSVFAMSPGQVHHWELSDDADGFIFFHTKSFYEMRYADEKLSNYAFFSQVEAVNSVEIPKDKFSGFVNYFRKMSEVNPSDEKAKRHFVIALITQVYVEMKQFSSAQNPTGKTLAYASKFSKFGQLLEANFRIEKSPDKYAAMLNITAKHLNRINQETVAKSTSEIIIERVLLEAKRLLIHSDGNFSEIASMLGYDDYAYFSKLFRKKVGVTVSGFAKREV